MHGSCIPEINLAIHKSDGYLYLNVIPEGMPSDELAEADVAEVLQVWDHAPMGPGLALTANTSLRPPALHSTGCMLFEVDSPNSLAVPGHCIRPRAQRPSPQNDVS